MADGDLVESLERTMKEAPSTHCIEIKEMEAGDQVESLTSRMKEAHCNQWRQEPCSIFRVPFKLRWSHIDAYDQNLIYRGPYDPFYVSIGPYHRGKPQLRPMEEFKLRALQHLLSRNPTITLARCLEEMKGLELRARSCYSEAINMLSEEFVEMMLLDGCFTVFILTCELDDLVWMPGEGLHGIEHSVDGGGIAPTVALKENVMYDLLLLENQIPYFVLKALFNLLITGLSNENISLEQLAIECLSDIYPARTNPSVSGDQVQHLLHLLYLSIIPVIEPQKSDAPSKKLLLCDLLSIFIRKQKFPSSSGGPNNSNFSWIPSMTEMKEAGVRFKVKNSTSLLDVTFCNGVIEIPTLVLDDTTKSMLHNLVAYEQCYRYTKDHVTCYTVFMDCLVNTPADVSILQDEKIMKNDLGSENEAAQFINQLGIEVRYDWNESYLFNLFNEVNRFCGSRRNKWRAKLVHDYFSNPWAIISLGAAVVLLILTFLQTFFAMYTYFHPSS
ncbi:UPF0481 protein [Acorus calamus]|uniref:UPF0481 protein n=1 Tax=Acorus calamus TaxID=4465 RepID=A0AAV9DBH2_ACOCL|nr:UPF0481 protein [Acorus calamus]